MSEQEIHCIIVVEVVEEIREAILELFGSVKTVLIEEFDRHYTAVLQVATAQPQQPSPLYDLREVGKCSTESSVIQSL